MSQEKDRREVIRLAASLGWRVEERENKNGYLKMKRRCGKHMKWLHKTPSNPNYWNETSEYLRTICTKGLPSPRDGRPGGG